MACQYAYSVARVFVRRFQSEYKLGVATVLNCDGEVIDVTAAAMAALAARDREWFIKNDTTITYTYMGVGPYKYHASAARDPVFPPPPPTRTMVPPSQQIIMVEIDGEDVTEDLAPFAGPDGTFHGECDISTETWGAFDARRALRGRFEGVDVYEVTFADGQTRNIAKKEEEEEENL